MSSCEDLWYVSFTVDIGVVGMVSAMKDELVVKQISVDLGQLLSLQSHQR